MRNIIFDWDGTIADSAPGIIKAVMRMAEDYHIDMPNEVQLRSIIGPPLKDGFINVLGIRAEDVDDAIKKYRDYYSRAYMFDSIAYPGIELLLESLCVKNNLFVATSKPTEFTKCIIKHFGFDYFFCDVCGSTMDNSISKKSDIIRFLIKKNSLDSNECIMVGDKSHDIYGAKANAVRAYGVLWGYGKKEELVSAKADGIFETVEQCKIELLKMQ